MCAVPWAKTGVDRTARSGRSRSGAAMRAFIGSLRDNVGIGLTGGGPIPSLLQTWNRRARMRRTTSREKAREVTMRDAEGQGTAPGPLKLIDVTKGCSYMYKSCSPL